MTNFSELPGWIAKDIALYRKGPEKAHMWDSTQLSALIRPALTRGTLCVRSAEEDG